MDAGSPFYSMSIDKSCGKKKKFVDKNKYERSIIFGGDQETNKELWNYFHLVAIPKYYTVDGDGTIINVAHKLEEEFIKNLK